MFRKPKKPSTIRAKPSDNEKKQSNASDGEDDDSNSKNIEGVREAQKARERRHGINAIECAVGAELAKEWEFNGRLTEERKAALAAAGIENDIKEQFKKETLLRDEHEEMKKYIEVQLKRKCKGGDSADDDESDPKKQKGQTIEDEILFRAASTIKSYTSKNFDEQLSNQMLVGIPEVDLGIDVRMENIVETEKKKMELLEKLKRNKK